MYARVFAVETGGGSSESDVSVSDNMVALRAGLAGPRRIRKATCRRVSGIGLRSGGTRCRRRS